MKINGSNEEMLAYAAEQFGSKPWVHEIWAVLESQKHNQLHFMTIVDLFFISAQSYQFFLEF